MSLLTGDEKVQSLQTRYADGVEDLEAFGRLWIQVMESDAWKSFCTPNGNPVTPKSFRDFITAARYDGLGTTPEKIAVLLGENSAAVIKMRKLLKNQGARNDLGNNVTEVGRSTVTGNRRDYTLERLARDRPDLLARVDAKEITAHAAAIQAGFRPKTFTVRADNPDKIAATLRRQLPPDVLTKVIHLLEGW